MSDSLTSDATDVTDATEDPEEIEEQCDVTQVRRIAGRPSLVKAVGEIITRGLTRTSSIDYASDRGLVIDVSTTVECHPDSDAMDEKACLSPSTVSAGTPKSTSNWMKVLTDKIYPKARRNRALSEAHVDVERKS
jgi:hypothetical protein